MVLLSDLFNLEFSFFSKSWTIPLYIFIAKKSTCILEIQIVINKTNITYMNLNV